MPRLYLGDPNTANRLHAARKAAGFRSGRAAALKHGISESLLRAHETATRRMDDDDVQAYARAFAVSKAWLGTGKGEGPEIDRKREERLGRRYQSLRTEEHQGAPPAARRLRVARRLAGYRLTEAAAKFGWSRTTATSHETGQNAIPPEWARAYGVAYGADPAWIRTGARPSGHPAEIERHLEALGELHSETEAKARCHFPTFRPPAARAAAAPLIRRPAARKLRSLPAEDLPAIAMSDLIDALREGRSARPAPQHRFSLPPRFLNEVFDCDPERTIVVAAPNAFADIEAGDRLFIDTAQTEPTPGAEYVAVGSDGKLAPAVLGARGVAVLGRLVAQLRPRSRNRQRP